ncbi:Serine/threonine-protein phosphatase PP1-2 [Tritrichomonas foetus]|uniref:Serine/threonine-protein phosphatase n=1 Tax=Tritrichomonas foetus TaxID=1144522 RepID=A0A1J4JDI8_9EUKA|nr:Serine/threonine-protein phosphatase PP1-2 [Tritrichomonas foetus]|eukprot:OHS95739.1 Serine/threonine-protein phosphatase PP1-2 [Tritrichomonas foetus]
MLGVGELDHLVYHVLLTRINPELKINDLITFNTLARLVATARVFLDSEPVLLRINKRIQIIGDIHGNIDDLIRIFEKCGYPPKTNYLFLGDYVDRGPASIEVITLLLALKCKYPSNIYLLRGNHETSLVSRAYGFYRECEVKYSSDLFFYFMRAFHAFPLAAIIMDTALCVHGGISPSLDSIESFEMMKKPEEILTQTVFSDILWSDPKENEEGFQANTRGCGYFFNEKVLNTFLQNNNLQMIIRSHEEKEYGYEWAFPESRNCLTIFSNSDYCGHNNYGIIILIDENLVMDKEFLLPMTSEDKEKRRIILPEWLLDKIDQIDVPSSPIPVEDYISYDDTEHDLLGSSVVQLVLND